MPDSEPDLKPAAARGRLAPESGAVSGAVHPTRFRTAPLWGIGYRMSRETRPTFLHDGRARSVEEAVLWHDGEAAVVRERFEHLPRERREQLLRFVNAL